MSYMICIGHDHILSDKGVVLRKLKNMKLPTFWYVKIYSQIKDFDMAYSFCLVSVLSSGRIHVITLDTKCSSLKHIQFSGLI